jgi:RES domain-containing protein
MTDPVSTVLRAAPVLAWEGDVWRVHTRRYAATDPGGSLRSQGRWHRGGRTFPPDQVFAALYTAVSDAVATWECIRHSPRTSATEMWLRFTSVNLSRLHLSLSTVLDFRDPVSVGVDPAALLGPDYTLPQAIGAAAFEQKLEGLLVPSATGVGETDRDYNVIVFTDNLRPGSDIRFVESKAPNLPP